MERDIRSEQMRDAIDHAWRIWDNGKHNLDALRLKFNTAVVNSQGRDKND